MAARRRQVQTARIAVTRHADSEEGGGESTTWGNEMQTHTKPACCLLALNRLWYYGVREA